MTPSSGLKEDAILLFTDGRGNMEANISLADNFAANGFFTVMPTLFDGDNLPDVPNDPKAKFDLKEWKRRNLPSKVKPFINAVILGMRSVGAKRIGGVGYHVGAKYLARFMGQEGLCTAFMAQPEWLEEEDILAINAPVSLAFGR